MTFDEKYWNDRWINGETGWDIGYASPPITEYCDQIKNRDIRILIPGAGNAYEAEYLHSKGFQNVFVMDLSETALENLSNRAPSFPKKHLIHGDFFDLEMQFDLILEQTFFCALDPSLRADYVSQMLKLLSKGGNLVGLLFEDPLNDDHPPFGGSTSEYLDLFETEFEIHTMEIAYNSIKPRQGRELFVIMRKK